MNKSTVKFNPNISILHQEIIKSATIIDEGIQDGYPYSSNGCITPTKLKTADSTSTIQNGFHEDLLRISQPSTSHSATIIDEGIPEPYQTPTRAPLTHAEIIKNATIIDEGIKLCPICRSEVRLFFINFNEKVLMCENFDCDYPFGHDEIVFVKENNNIQSNEEVASIRSKNTMRSPTGTCSVISAAAWSDIDKINKVNDTEGQTDNRSETREYYKHKKSLKKEKRSKNIEDNPKILKEVEAIAKMHIEMKTVDESCIKNEKWIKNLMNMQQSSGMSLLKPEEINMFKQKKPEIGFGELKIDINPGSQENMSLIKIEIAKTEVEEDDASKL